MQKRLGRGAWLYGAAGGMAADLDVLIRSGSDPLVAWTYHRHFTHSLSLVPVGGVLSALPWLLRERFADRRREIVAATTLGYATHALLDAFTSYGTQLWWPLSNLRVAWHWIGIIDPLFTIPLGIGVVLAAVRNRLRPLWIALVFCALYMAWGGVQHSRAVAEAERLASARGHVPTRVEALPGVFTNVLWRSLYEADGFIYVDAVHVPWLGAVSSEAGGSVPRHTEDDLTVEQRSDPGVVEAFGTFTWFADGWVAPTPGAPQRLGDVRYGSGVGRTEAMWGIELHPGREHPASGWRSTPDATGLRRMSELWISGFEP